MSGKKSDLRQVKEYESLNDGQRVVFPDGTAGRVLIGSSARSLIDYRPDPDTGCTSARDWFYNKTLKVRG